MVDPAGGGGCLLAGWFYTGGPRPYGYVGLGELFVFVFFGLVATVGTFYVQTLRLGVPVVWFAAAAVGLLATALLLANNLRDIATDTVSGKRTLAVRVGRRARWLALRGLRRPALRGRGGLGPAVGDRSRRDRPARSSPSFPLWPCPSWPGPVRLVRSDADGRALLPVLAATGRLQLAFGVLLSVALWLWMPLWIPSVSG